MRFNTEEQQKKCIASKQPLPFYLIYGSDSELILSFRKKLCAMLEEFCSEPDIMDGRNFDLPAFYDAAQLVSFFGGRRLIIVKDFEPENLTPTDCAELCSFIKELTDDVTVIFSASVDSLDAKKGKNAKKLLEAADRAGASIALDQRDPASLKPLIRSRCKKLGCELSNDDAAFLIERCGSDLSTLFNECDKLCAYADGTPITVKMITEICSGTLSADPFALSRLMLKGDLAEVLARIDALIRMKQPVVLIMSNISSAFCNIARASAARAEGKSADQFAADFSFRFQWMAQNAYRDSSRLTVSKAFEICEVFSDAETQLKSSPHDDRTLLETAVIRAMHILGGAR